ncbi:MAG: lantibiotic dehydratase [Pseudonocardia sp.]
MYEYLDAALLRLSTHLVDEQRIGWPDLTTDTPAAVLDQQHWLRQVWENETFAAAVELSSPVLADRIEKLRAQPTPPPRALRRVVVSTVKYLQRATSRATPFGLFAGVAPLHIGSKTDVQLGRAHRATARVDADWLAAVVDRLHRCPRLLGRLSVVVNDLAFVRDGRLVIASRPVASVGAAVSTTEVSVRLGGPVETVLRRAEKPITMNDLAAVLAASFPTTPTPIIDTLLIGLVTERFLLTELQPPMTTTGPLTHLIETAICAGADSIPDISTLLSELREVRTTLQRHDNTATPAAQRALRVAQRALRVAATTRMHTIHATQRPLTVDLRVDAQVELPKQVVREAEAATTALARLSPTPSGSAQWSDYHRRFLDRYGIGAVVGLRDLLHADTGLGYPAGYRGSTLPTPPSRGRDRRGEGLMAIAHAAAWDRCREVVLTEPDLAELCAGVPSSPQPHTELRVEVHAATRDALDRGEFRLSVVGMSRAAGTITGRFLDLLDPHEQARMFDTYAALPTTTAGALRAQVSGPPVNPRAGNIARSPQVLPHQLTVAEHPGAGSNRIPLSDIGVSADTTGLYLLSISREQPIDATTFTAIELVRSAHPTLRLLSEMSTARSASCTPFTWGAARELPYLPRIRHGRTHLSPARWTLHADDLPNRTASTRSWNDRMRAWQRHWNIPRSVLLGEHDRRLHLDLDEPAHRHILRDTTTRRGRVTLLEAPPADAFGWIDGRAHELVLPMASTTPTTHPPRPRRIGNRIPEPDHLPGASRWLYARLYCHPARPAAILTAHLPRLLHDLRGDIGSDPSWWFVRHTDPTHHIRLRIHLPTPQAFGAAACRVGAWADELRAAGLLPSMQLATYVPETGRFGYGAAMRAAEAVFAADSAAALAQLALVDVPDAVTATSLLDLVTSFSPTQEQGMRWLLRHAPRSIDGGSPRDVRARTVELTRQDTTGALRSLPGGNHVIDAWTRRTDALGTYRAALLETGAADPDLVLPDLLHLHHARVAGPSLDAERTCLHLARAAALSRTTRTGRAA